MKLALKMTWLSFAAILGSNAMVDQAEAAGPAALARGLLANTTPHFVSEKNRTAAPFAHVMFCTQNPSECAQGSGSTTVDLTPAAEQQLQEINLAVNRSIKPASDRASGGVGDVWQVNVSSGDCEDYALTKRDHLIAKGWSSAALRVAVVKTSWGEGHAVLVVRTDHGDLVLDSLTSKIKEWTKTDLHWLMIQSGTDPKIWFNL